MEADDGLWFFVGEDRQGVDFGGVEVSPAADFLGRVVFGEDDGMA